MARPVHCTKCGKNTWKVSFGEQKQIFLTCLCGYNFSVKPPTAQEVLRNNTGALRKAIENMVVICPLSLRCKTECTGAWMSCYQETMRTGMNSLGNKVDVPGR